MTDKEHGPDPAPAAGQVLTVNVGQVRTITWLKQTATTAIWKEPVAGRIALRGVNLAGDTQADRQVHGGPDKAVYVYAQEDTRWWEGELGRPLLSGNFGENLTLRGVEVTEAVVGEIWAIGTAVLQVAQPRVPCWKLGARLGDPHFPDHFARAGRPGAYLRIIQEGDVGAGDAVRVLHRPAHGLTVGEVARRYHAGSHDVELLLAVPELSAGWHEWARKRLAYRRRPS
jgi:MOSC domain-containing protein YiiM